MADITALVRWIITYGVTGGFWHFVAVLLLLNAVTRIFRFVTIDIKRPATKEKDDD